jgi:hypothetical protein
MATIKKLISNGKEDIMFTDIGTVRIDYTCNSVEIVNKREIINEAGYDVIDVNSIDSQDFVDAMMLLEREGEKWQQ